MSSLIADFLRAGDRADAEWVNGCSGKKQHETQAEAFAVLQRLNSTPNKGRDLEVYKCKHCDSWHTGTRRTRK